MCPLNRQQLKQWITKFAWVIGKVFDPSPEIRWVVKLATTNDVKRDIKTTKLDKSRIEQILLEPQPRFIWRASVIIRDEEQAEKTLVEILLDATGMGRSQPAFEILFYDTKFREQFAQVLTVSQWAGNIDAPLLDFLRERSA